LFDLEKFLTFLSLLKLEQMQEIQNLKNLMQHYYKIGDMEQANKIQKKLEVLQGV
jgi:hypothetical protein